ncbi:MAG TPA: glycoside hydrolase family 32 protein [Armatimonadota bacterium]
MPMAYANSTEDFGEQALRDRQALASDPQRPVYHFVAPKNWMNDPNGLIQLNGEYHLFYQHNPQGAAWGNMTWGHASSRDLVHWKDLPFALRPDAPYDKDGVFSGCMVNDAGTATAVYTGTAPEVQCIATSKDMLTWQKPSVNPVIPGPPPGLQVTGFRDPFVWKDGAGWLAVIGSGIRDVGGAILLYRSKDLRTWEYLHPAFVGDKTKTGDMWECPNLFALGNKWVLMVSTNGQSYHFVGSFLDGKFSPESEAGTDQGGGLYAPLTFRDGKGRRIMFGWLWEQRGDAARYGWQGAQSLPRVITLGTDGRLRYEPAREVESLRGERTRLKDVSVTPGGLKPLNGVKGDALEIDAHIAPGEAQTVGLVVRRSPGGEEETRIVYDAKAGTLSVDRSQSSTDPNADKGARSAPLKLVNGEALNLRVFIDHSVLEVFANGRTCLTSRIYPSRPDSLGVGAFAEGGAANIRQLDAWTMKPIWPTAAPSAR